jgi:hypothetical protein
MSDDNTTDNNSAAKPPAKKAADTGSAVKKAGKVKKSSTAKKAGSESKEKVTEPMHVSDAVSKAVASKDSDMRHAAEKISEIDKHQANESIRTKKNAEEFKGRAHEAKLRAQKKILDKSFVSDPADSLERLADTFDSSARRWEMVVYPSLFAFVLLAGYGFFLIYRLTHDIAILSQSVTHMAVIVSDAMPRMSKDLNSMTGSIDNMTGNIDGMTGEIVSMSGQMNALTPMSHNIRSMTNNIGSMNRSVYGMQRDMHGMNRTVSSGPFGMMNDVMPFTSDTNVPPGLAPQPVWPSYNPNMAPAQRPVYTQPQAMPKQQAKSRPVPKAEVRAKGQDRKQRESSMHQTSPLAVKDRSAKSIPALSVPRNNPWTIKVD